MISFSIQTKAFYSAASTGWGLMIDAVAAETGLISKKLARAQAKQTLENINTKWPRDNRGWFCHYTGDTFQPVGS